MHLLCGLLGNVGALMPNGNLGPGLQTPGGSPQGTGAPRGLSCWGKMAAGAAGWAHVVLVPGKPGGAHQHQAGLQ